MSDPAQLPDPGTAPSSTRDPGPLVSVRGAYLGVIAVWTATPLAVKWSSDSVGFLFGVTSRMTIGTLCVGVLLALARIRLPWHRAALQSYFAGALGIYGAMLVIHWSSQFIPSGWTAMLFGLAPLITALMAAAWLGEQSLTPIKLIGLAFGLGGLLVIFSSAADVGAQAVVGVCGVLVATTAHSASAVLVKRVNASIPALCVAGGSLLVSLPAYLLTWWIADGHWPAAIPARTALAIGYLGVITTGLGFAMYYYVLKHLPATRVAMVAMVAPVLALLLGILVNDEPLTLRAVVGAAMVLLAVLMHEVLPRWVA